MNSLLPCYDEFTCCLSPPTPLPPPPPFPSPQSTSPPGSTSSRTVRRHGIRPCTLHLRPGRSPLSADLRLRAPRALRRRHQAVCCVSLPVRAARLDRQELQGFAGQDQDSRDRSGRPAWYKEKVYPENKVPALEHNNQVKGESLDLVTYIDSNFDGPALLPDDSAKKRFAEELIAFSDGFNSAFFSCLRSKGDVSHEAAAAVDKIEAALGKFSDGPFFLGQFSLVDIAYVPFIERFQIFYHGVKNDDISKGRPNLHKFIEEVNKIDAYTQTKLDPQFLLAQMKEKFAIA